MPELPLTPVGKIYKPALKALAARHAIEERLKSLDLPAALEIAVSDGAAKAVIRVAGEPGSDRRVKEALLGLPIECEVAP